jgi:hypothetical protein
MKYLLLFLLLVILLAVLFVGKKEDYIDPIFLNRKKYLDYYPFESGLGRQGAGWASGYPFYKAGL